MRRNSTSVTLIATILVVAVITGIEGDSHRVKHYCPKHDPVNKTIHLPHEWDCTKFYKCLRGVAILFQCPFMDQHGNRLHFNSVMEVCDWPQHAGCIHGNKPTTVKPWTFSTEKTTRVTSSDGTQPCPTLLPPVINIPHESNCSLYYEVANGQRKLKECPQGSHFSPTWLICMKAEDAGCEQTTVALQTTTETSVPLARDCGDISDGWLIPHECACDKYYQCSNGDFIRRQCSKGLHFNPKIYSCDYPAAAGCDTTTTIATTTKLTTSTIPSECPPGNTGHTVQIPHPTNCSLFYKCDNGEKQQLQCPEGLHFNPTVQMCDWPDHAGCTASTGTTEIPDEPSTFVATTSMTSTEASSIVTTADNATTVSPSTSAAPTECPPDNSDPPVSLPNPYNCSLYYTCNDGEKVLQSCPSGLEFNARKQRCDWPASAGCVALTTTATSTPDESSGSSTTAQTSTTTKRVTSSIESTDSSPSNPDSKCPPGMDGHQISHETNCSLYYECKGSQKILRECTPGLHFSPVLELCVWPTNAGCESTTVSSESSSTSSDEYSTDGPLNSPSATPSTPAQDPDATVESESASCSGTCPRKDPEDFTFMLPHEDCTKFCKCSNSKPYVYDCPVGLHFNPTKLVCDYPESAKCVGQGGYGQPENEA